MGRFKTKDDVSNLVGAAQHLRGGGKDDANELLTPLRESAAESEDQVADIVVLFAWPRK